MSNVNVLQVLISYLIPTFLGATIGFFISNIKKNRVKEKAIEEGVKALLKNELVNCYREYEIKGEMTILDKENIEEMFTQYQNLGGNGTVKQLMTELMELPIKIIKE
jgi:ATP-dependent 26S proteasome regulatory subunit